MPVVNHLAGALYKLSSFSSPMQLNDVTRAYFGQMAKIERGPMAADLAAVAADSEEAMKRVAAENAGMNSMLV
jgi:hypothetical protein